MAREPAYSYQQLVDIAKRVGFTPSEAKIMAAIALAESGGRTDAHNPNANTGDNSYGLWQINMIGSMGSSRRKQFGSTSNSQLFNALTNARAAYAIFKGQGRRFTDWTTYTTKNPQRSYRRFLPGGAQYAATAAAPAATRGTSAPAPAPAPGTTAPAVNSWIITGGKPYPITQKWGNKSSQYVSGVHTGVDIGVPMNTRIYSVSAGTVIESGNKGAWGNYVLVKGTDGNTYRYGHLSSRDVARGTQVSPGTLLGKSGSTGRSSGPHLHFEVRASGNKQVDPMRYLTAGGTPGVAEAAGDRGYSQEFLDAQPEIAALVRKAAGPPRWSDSRFEQELRKTDWWRNISASQKAFDAGMIADPAYWNEVINNTYQGLKQTTTALGLNIPDATLRALSREFTRNGTSEAEQKWRLSQFYRQAPTGAIPGAAGTSQASLKQTAGNYGIKLSDATLQNWVQQILAGRATTFDFEDSMRTQAQTLYKPIASDLERGLTTREILDPYLGIAGQELGINVGDADLTDPKWTRAIFGPTGKMMTADEWTSTVRSDTRYGWDRSTNARNAATSLTGQMAQMFGALG